jgi:hypothetical protein
LRIIQHSVWKQSSTFRQPFAYGILRAGSLILYLQASARTCFHPHVTLCGVSEAGVECIIEQIDVCQSTGTYQALSYVWGSGEKPFRAVLRESKDGKILGSISLTTNLNSALHDIWSAEGLESKVLWTDQICIDQGGAEKSHQVSLMGQIYKNAARVITYLGPAIERDSALEQRGFQLLKRLYDHFTPNYEKLAGTFDAADADERRSELPVKSLPDCLDELDSEETRQWIASLCVGEWASRLWMVQEQLLNEVEVVMLRGSCLISWDTSNTSLMPSLFSNLLNYEQLQCRDPHDRIFALLAISSDAKTDLGSIPNYEEPASHTFWRVSISILEGKNRSLDLLAMACQLENFSDPGCPSWSLKIPAPRHLRSWNLVYGV